MVSTMKTELTHASLLKSWVDLLSFVDTIVTQMSRKLFRTEGGYLSYQDTSMEKNHTPMEW